MAIAKRKGSASRLADAEARYRAFAYVKPHPHVFDLLCVLSSHDISLLVYSPGLDVGVKERLSLQGRMRFLDEPANMVDVAEASDFLVLNAGHGSTATALLSGTPILQMPLNMEQVITARNTVRIGAGVGVDAARPLTFNQTVGTFLARLDEHRAQANFFAEQQPTCAENYAQIARQVGALL